ncbi:MAG TPA: hypothetical protein VGC66_22670 [Pyrinomonadaceae bacterium]|jgi:hypothetical protein
MAEDRGVDKKRETPQDRLTKSSASVKHPSKETIEQALKDDFLLKRKIRAAFARVDRVRARAQKTQAEIDKLKKETRALIKEMQAA